MEPAAVNDMWKDLLAEHLGVRFVETSADRVVAELKIGDHLRTIQGNLHGGTLMALADTVGGTAALINLPEGAATATIESKTNFFAAGKSGTVRAEATPLHKRPEHVGVADAGDRRVGEAAVADDTDAGGAAEVRLRPCPIRIGNIAAFASFTRTSSTSTRRRRPA
jgi:uncharacterized protein (TIGR00369 family)